MDRAFQLIRAVTMLAALTDAPALPPQPKVPPKEYSPQAIHLPAPAEFPAAARQALTQRMDQHADELEWLLSAALMLNYDVAERAATSLADDPRLAQPTPGELDTVNAMLPKRFFVLQARLSTRARAVAEAARTHDDRKLGRAVGRLTETCVACHSVYLYGANAVAGDDED